MDSSVAETVVELEAMRKEDSSWHPCQVSLCSTGVGLVVDFGSQDSEYIILNKDEAHMRLRVRSVPLQGDDCSSIEQGEHVLATNKSQFKSLFFDAEVEKALRVRHSKKIHCRCTFTIKWLHQDPRGGSLTVPSSSIMKLAGKSINVHPTVAAFFNSIKTFGCSDASLFPTILKDMDYEMDLQKLLEKQIEELSNLVDASKKDISEDILLGVKVDIKGQLECKPVAACRGSISHVQVPPDQNNSRRSTRSRSKMQVEMEVKDPPPPAPSIPEDLSESRSHLSPLAARAAFASLMSKFPQKLKFSSYHEEGKAFTCASNNTTRKHVAMEPLNGSESFDCFIGNNNMSMTDKLSSEIEAASDPVVPEPVEIVKSLISTGTGASGNPQFVEASSGIPTKQGGNENKTSEISNSSESLTCSITKRKLSQPTEATRLTRSAIQRGSGISNDNANMRTSAEEMKLSALTNVRRLTRSSVKKENENLTMEVKQGMDDNKSAQCTESDSSEGNVTVLESHLLKKKKPASSSLDTEINLLPIEERNKKRKMSSAGETTQKTEGKVSGNDESSQGQKRKSTSSKKQELRFSPRLRFLPRTRSQSKS